MAALVAAIAAASAAAPAAQAAPAGWSDTAAAIAAPWPGLQARSGHFADYVTRRAPSSDRDDYGDAMLGYGLLLTAARNNDANLRDAGLRAIGYALRSRGHAAVAPFRFAALAASYNLVRGRFADAPLFTSLRARWERSLQGVRVLRLGRSAVTNKSLVEAVEVLELARSGLGSSRRGTVLHARRHAVALVKRLLARDLPRAAAPFRRSAGRAGHVALLGDFSGVPLPYHALASGFLARAVELLGPAAPAAARQLLRESAAASWALATPDGDVGYIGRSQEQSWTLPLTAYAAEAAVSQPGAGPAWPGRLRALSERSVNRLGSVYRVGREGLLITPALGSDLSAGIRGLDPYVAAASYNGLTLTALEWAIGAARDDTAPSETGADRDGSFVMGRGARTFAVVRRGDVWFAVKQARSDRVDLRYDFGLVALRVRDPETGAWRSPVPLRPRAERAGDSAGPVLRVGAAGLPEGTRTSVDGSGNVVVSGGYRARTGRWVRRGVRFRFAPVACGVRMSVPARRGDAYDYSAFFSGRPSIAGATTRSGGQSVTFTPAWTAWNSSAGYASGSDPRITRTRVRLLTSGKGTIRVETCAR